MMAKRQVFFSFHFDNDAWRAGQVRNMGMVDGNNPVSSNEWEEIKRKGDDNIKNWIDENLKYRSCTVVLVGSKTASRKWVRYEIQRSWELGKGVVGICIHNLKDEYGKQAIKGPNPFSAFNIDNTAFDRIVRLYDPPFYISTDVYNDIQKNIVGLVEEAIAIRIRYN
jgi:hypothetical protein